MTPFMHYSRKLLLSIFLCFSLVQCSDQANPEQADHIRILDEIPQHIQEVENLTIFPGDSEPLYSIDLIQEQTYGQSGEAYLLRISKCVVDDKGRLIIWGSRSNYEQYIHVYNADGSYHTQLGRRGRGPGEYEIVVGMQAEAGKVFVLDYTSQRLNEYSTQDYSVIRSILIEQWDGGDEFRFGYVEPRNGGNYQVIFSENRSKFGRLEIKFQVMDHEGNSISDKPLVFADGFRIKVRQSMQPTMPLLFLGKTITALSDEDVLYVAWTRDFLIRKYDANYDYQSSFYYPIGGHPFDLNEYTKAQVFSPKAHDIENAFSNMDEDLPDTFPVIDKLMVDDESRIWVAVPKGSQREHYEWWILKESGELLAKLLLPRDQPIYDIKNGYLFSKEINEETGAGFVVKYRIELKE